jgi:hypothetical protein
MGLHFYPLAIGKYSSRLDTTAPPQIGRNLFLPSCHRKLLLSIAKIMKAELSIARLEASLDAKIERYFDTLDTDPDVLKQLLADKRSENTRRAYERDVNDFLKTMTGTPACLITFWSFCTLRNVKRCRWC